MNNNNQNFIGDENPNSLSNNISVGNTLPINNMGNPLLSNETTESIEELQIPHDDDMINQTSTNSSSVTGIVNPFINQESNSVQNMYVTAEMSDSSFHSNGNNLKNKKIMLISIIVVFGIIIVTLGIVFLSGDKKTSKPNDELPINNGVVDKTSIIKVPEPLLYQIDKNNHVYVDDDGKFLKFGETIQEDLAYTDFTYGSSVINKNYEEYKIIDYKGNTLVDYGKYRKIRLANFNFIAKTKDGKEIVLDNNGKEVPGFLYDSIYQIVSSNIYIAQDGAKNILITASGCKFYETSEPISIEDVKIYDIPKDFLVVQISNHYYVVDKNNYEVTFHLQGDNIGVGYDYLTDISKKTTYLFDNKANMIMTFSNCFLTADSSWEQYRAIYRGCDIRNHLEEGYIFYTALENGSKVLKIIYKDQEEIASYNLGDKSFSSTYFYLDNDTIFIKNENDIDVYNGKKKVKTIQNRTLSSYNYDKDYIVLEYAVNTQFFVELYNKDGSRFNESTYQQEFKSTIMVDDNGNRLRLINGELVDAKDFYDIIPANDYKTGKTYNKYFIGIILDDEQEKHYYLIDSARNKILEFNSFNPFSEYKLYDDEVFIYRDPLDTSCWVAYHLENKEELFRVNSELSYQKDFNIIESGDYNKRVYSITEGSIYTK